MGWANPSFINILITVNWNSRTDAPINILVYATQIRDSVAISYFGTFTLFLQFKNKYFDAENRRWSEFRK